MPRNRFAPALALLLAGCLPIVKLHTNEPFTAANVVLPSAGLRAIHVEVNSGRVALQRAVGDSIRVNAMLVSHDADRVANVCAQSTRLIRESSDGTLRLKLEQSSREQCGERWIVDVPASLGVSVDVRVGDVVSDVAVTSFSASIGVLGSVKGRVETDDVDVRVQQGDIELTTKAGDLELARVESDLGSVSLELRGMQVQPMRRPGRGAVAEVTGRGRGKVIAHTKHGSATLKVQ